MSLCPVHDVTHYGEPHMPKHPKLRCDCETSFPFVGNALIKKMEGLRTDPECTLALLHEEWKIWLQEWFDQHQNKFNTVKQFVCGKLSVGMKTYISAEDITKKWANAGDVADFESEFDGYKYGTHTLELVKCLFSAVN